MFRNRTVYIAVSAVVSAVLLWLLFSRVDLADLVNAFSRVFVPALLVYAVVALLGAWLRAWRYKWLLRPQRIGWANILLVTFIRNSLIDLLPARLGSLSYIYVLNRRLGFAFETATSSFVLALVLDFLTISPFLIVSLLIVGVGAKAISGPFLLIISAAFFLIIGIIFWKIVPIARLGLVFLSRLLSALRVAQKKSVLIAMEKLEKTVATLAQVRSAGIDVPIFVLSLLIRLAKYVSIYALFYAFLKAHRYSLHDLSFWVFILGLSGAELTSALPVKGLAGFGTWESAWALAFRLLGFDPKLAVISGIGVHFLTNLFEYTLGLASILVLVCPYLRRRRKR